MQTNTTIFDYDNQAWTVKGKYITCNHPEKMNCNCYGKLHAGELANIINPKPFNPVIESYKKLYA